MVTPPRPPREDYDPHQPLRRSAGCDWLRGRSQWETALLAGEQNGGAVPAVGAGREPQLFPAARFSLPAALERSGAAPRAFQRRRSLPRPAPSVEFPTNPWKIPGERVPAQQLEAEEDARLDQTDQNSRRGRRDPAADAEGEEIPEPLREPREFSGNSSPG